MNDPHYVEGEGFWSRLQGRLQASDTRLVWWAGNRISSARYWLWRIGGGEL